MGNFIEDLVGNFGGEITEQLTSSLGIDSKTASALIPQVAPLILGGLKKQMQDHGGAPRVDHILNKYGSASVLDNLGGLFSEKAKESNPDPRLGGLLGDSGVQASNFLSQNFNLDGNTSSKLITMLAPVVLGALTQKRDAGGAGSSGIASLLDADGDGSILDDVGGFLLNNFGGSVTKNAGGLLGGLLGGLFGKKS